MSMMSQAAKHEANHGDVDQRLARLTPSLILSAQSATLRQPAKCPLHHPSSRQYSPKAGVRRRKSFVSEPYRAPIRQVAMRNPSATRLTGMLHDFYFPAESLFDPGLADTRVALIHPHQINVGKLLLDPLQ